MLKQLAHHETLRHSSNAFSLGLPMNHRLSAKGFGSPFCGLAVWPTGAVTK